MDSHRTCIAPASSCLNCHCWSLSLSLLLLLVIEKAHSGAQLQSTSISINRVSVHLDHPIIIWCAQCAVSNFHDQTDKHKKRIFQKWQNLLYFSHLARKPWPQPYPPVASQPELNFPVVWRAGNPFTESHPAWGLYIWRLTNWWELWNYCFSCKYTFCPWKKISIQYIRTIWWPPCG